MIWKLQTISSYFLNLLLYLIAFAIPKNKNIWLFGSWSGQRYADNSRYLFEYIDREKNDIKNIWITKNKALLNQLKNENKTAYIAHSIPALWYSMRARVLFVTQTISGDLCHYCNHPLILKVQLWHGVPLKKILHDSPFAKNHTKFQKKRKIINFIFPFYEEKYDYLVATSAEDRKNFSTAFLIPEEKIEILGYPRNDILFEKNSNSEAENKKTIYAPTLRRDNSNAVLDIFTADEINRMDLALTAVNHNLHIKLHPLNTPNDHLLQTIQKSQNIKLLSNEADLQEILKDYDILITDYSSVYFDFLVTNRPIIFAPFDYDNYLKNDRTFYYEYNDVTPGPKVKNWDEAISWIIKFSNEPQLYMDERKKIKDRFHAFQDSGSCKRICNYIKTKL